MKNLMSVLMSLPLLRNLGAELLAEHLAGGYIANAPCGRQRESLAKSSKEAQTVRLSRIFKRKLEDAGMEVPGRLSSPRLEDGRKKLSGNIIVAVADHLSAGGHFDVERDCVAFVQFLDKLEVFTDVRKDDLIHKLVRAFALGLRERSFRKMPFARIEAIMKGLPTKFSRAEFLGRRNVLRVMSNIFHPSTPAYGYSPSEYIHFRQRDLEICARIGHKAILAQLCAARVWSTVTPNAQGYKNVHVAFDVCAGAELAKYPRKALLERMVRDSGWSAQKFSAGTMSALLGVGSLAERFGFKYSNAMRQLALRHDAIDIFKYGTLEYALESGFVVERCITIAASVAVAIGKGMSRDILKVPASELCDARYWLPMEYLDVRAIDPEIAGIFVGWSNNEGQNKELLGPEAIKFLGEIAPLLKNKEHKERALVTIIRMEANDLIETCSAERLAELIAAGKIPYQKELTLFAEEFLGAPHMEEAMWVGEVLHKGHPLLADMKGTCWELSKRDNGSMGELLWLNHHFPNGMGGVEIPSKFHSLFKGNMTAKEYAAVGEKGLGCLWFYRTFKRAPKEWEGFVANALPEEMRRSFKWGVFEKQILPLMRRIDAENVHGVISMVVGVGLDLTKAWLSLYNKMAIDSWKCPTHEAVQTGAHANAIGIRFCLKRINPKNPPEQKIVRFVAENADQWVEYLTDKKLGLHSAHRYLLKKEFCEAGVQGNIAAACSMAGTSVDYALAYQEWYDANRAAAASRKSTLPDFAEKTMDGLTIRMLALDDPNGPILGYHTGCCQSIDAGTFNHAGSDSAKHGFLSENGRFLAFFDKDDQIVVQSHIWRQGDVVVFDSVEGETGRYMEQLKELYLYAAWEILKKGRGIKRVHGGRSFYEIGKPVEAIMNKEEMYRGDSMQQVLILSK